jgi:ssDNA-binding Zn-finger/Zn-ribbon topoisomerase 1
MSTQTQEIIVANSSEIEQARFMPVMSLSLAVQRRDVIIQAVRDLMKAEQDFGVIPGTQKPTLYQPGADKLNNLFGLVPRFETVERTEDWTGAQHGGESFFSYTVKCRLYRGDFLMGEGDGSCNSWESKYRYRSAERTCPNCGKPTIIKGKAEYGGGWICFAKKGGCGAKFSDNDPAIKEQIVGRVPNPDIADVVNTVLKMANKRAKIAATLNATSAHEFFTQDVEDMPEFAGHEPPTPTPQSKPQAAPPKPQQTPLEQALSTFGKVERIAEAYAELKARFLKHLDQNTWDQILLEHHCDGVKSFGTVGNAKKCFTVLWRLLEQERASAPADIPEPPEEM